MKIKWIFLVGVFSLYLGADISFAFDTCQEYRDAISVLHNVPWVKSCVRTERDSPQFKAYQKHEYRIKKTTDEERRPIDLQTLLDIENDFKQIQDIKLEDFIFYGDINKNPETRLPLLDYVTETAFQNYFQYNILLKSDDHIHANKQRKIVLSEELKKNISSRIETSLKLLNYIKVKYPHTFTCIIKSTRIFLNGHLEYTGDDDFKTEMSSSDLWSNAKWEKSDGATLNTMDRPEEFYIESDSIDPKFDFLKSTDFLKESNKYECSTPEIIVPTSPPPPQFIECLRVAIEEIVKLDPIPLDGKRHDNGIGHDICRFSKANWITEKQKIISPLVGTLKDRDQKEVNITCYNFFIEKSDENIANPYLVHFDPKHCQVIWKKNEK